MIGRSYSNILCSEMQIRKEYCAHLLANRRKSGESLYRSLLFDKIALELLCILQICVPLRIEEMPMIFTVSLNPALDKTLTLPGFAVNTVNRVQHARLDPGGKGINVSKTVKALGGDTLAIGVLGGAAGGYIKAALDAMELPNDVVITAEPTRTNIKIVDPVLQTSTDLNEPGCPISEETLQAVWKKLTQAVKPGDTVVFAGKNPPAMADDCLAKWITQLRSMHVRTCVDTVGKPMTLALEAHPDIIKPNKMELSEIMGRPIGTEGEVLDAARELAARGVGLVAASMGSNGAVFVTKDQSLRGYSPKVPVVSTVGAGDAMMAALAYYTAAGCSLEETARRAIAVSVAAVMIEGSQAAELASILPLIDRVRLERL